MADTFQSGSHFKTCCRAQISRRSTSSFSAFLVVFSISQSAEDIMKSDESIILHFLKEPSHVQGISAGISSISSAKEQMGNFQLACLGSEKWKGLKPCMTLELDIGHHLLILQAKIVLFG